MDESTSIAKNLQRVNMNIREYEKLYQRSENSVVLLGATKNQSIEKMQEAIDNGLTIFGENYLQEALEKMELLANKKIEWHYIGPIQSNKIKKIAEHFSWVQSVSSEKIAKSLNDHRPTDLPPLNICIEVNINAEASKSGASPNEVLALAEYCQSLPNIKLKGLMAIPKLTNSFEEQRKEFRELKKLFDSMKEKGFKVDTLSMGMSDDLEAAIAEGSTMVRVGTAIFGKRESL